MQNKSAPAERKCTFNVQLRYLPASASWIWRHDRYLSVSRSHEPLLVLPWEVFSRLVCFGSCFFQILWSKRLSWHVVSCSECVCWGSGEVGRILPSACRHCIESRVSEVSNTRLLHYVVFTNVFRFVPMRIHVVALRVSTGWLWPTSEQHQANLRKPSYSIY